MSHEIAIPFRSRLRGVTLVDPRAPLQAPPPVQPSSREAAPQQAAKVARPNQAEQDRAAIQAALAGVRNAIDQLRTREQQRLKEMQQVAIELAVAMASRLAHVKIQAGDFGLEELVREVIEQLDHKQPATLFLHPADFALLEQRIETIDSLFPSNENLRLGTDATLARGNCRMEFGDVSIWSHWQNHLPEIHEHLLRSIPDARARSSQA